ncbi:MAG: DUF1015 domain-containing protein [Lachnospiraceae bacterium]
MAEIRTFPCLRPAPKHAAAIAALPYDVYSRAEARNIVSENPLSFLKIDRPESQCAETIDIYSDEVYGKATQTLTKMTEEGYFLADPTPCYYVYELTFKGRSQTGLVGCAAVDDYLNGVIKKHENTRTDKENDRIRHIDTCAAQTGPIFLACRQNEHISKVISDVKRNLPLYDFTAADRVTHRVWRINDIMMLNEIYDQLSEITSVYIADGHHRAAAAVKTATNRRAANPDYNGDEEFNYFLSVLFPENELHILPYNRVVYDLNGHSESAFLDALAKGFEIKRWSRGSYAPKKRHELGMYLNKKWYVLIPHESLISTDPIAGLDVSILQDNILSPVLGIENPKLDERISFIGGIRGLGAVEAAVDGKHLAVGFSLFSTTMDELFSVSDAGKLMPPKSTWFEPKLRSGLFIHEI